jgi:hypothetical protein
MKKKQSEKSKQKSSTSEQISPKEALKRMESFSERKEKFIAAIKKSQN